VGFSGETVAAMGMAVPLPFVFGGGGGGGGAVAREGGKGGKGGKTTDILVRGVNEAGRTTLTI